MGTEFYKNESGNWVAPLPFRSPRQQLPNNKRLAQVRLATLKRTLEKIPEAMKLFVAFMERIFKNGHAGKAPPLKEGEECWYLHIFGVCHPQKPGEIRVVFDSSAQYENASLNSVLLTGPDLNSLLGVLSRFRKELVAVTADVQEMFYCFGVREDHRTYLRFLWFRNNNIHNDVVEYRMTVHVFGNSPSPAVENYALQRIAREGEEEFGTDAKQFEERDLYVDDGLKSPPTEEEAASLLKHTQRMLGASNLRLHKIASNSTAVMQAFPRDDRTKDLKDLDLGVDTLPIQRSLGICWDLRGDVFTFRVPKLERPFTRRGVLSTVNSLYDPLGFAASVTIKGRSLLRELITETCDWDAPLADEKKKEWEDWKDFLKALEDLHVPRTHVPASLSTARRKEAHIFSDASNKAVAAVAYLKITDQEGTCHVEFVMAKLKLVSRSEHTVPKLELCGAVLAVELAELTEREMNTTLNSVDFYCDKGRPRLYIQ